MKNIRMEIKDNILTLKIDLSERNGPSKSGKTIMIATTSGNVSLSENKDIKLGLNIYVKNPDYSGE